MGLFNFNTNPGKDALDFFKQKNIKPSFDYRDVWREEHIKAFSVAKGMQLDVLNDIQSAVNNAIANKIPFEQFQKDLMPLLQQKGWWGKSSMIDPLTGETKTVRLGSPARLRLIYDANIRTAEAAGQWERIQRQKKDLPYLLYQLGQAEQHRPEHVKLRGTLLPIDDEFWKTHYPPNGYNCRCFVLQISKNEYEQLSEKPEYTTTAPPLEYEDWLNKRTGKTEKVPKGVDAGWDFNAGDVKRHTEKLDVIVKDKLSALSKSWENSLAKAKSLKKTLWLTMVILPIKNQIFTNKPRFDVISAGFVYDGCFALARLFR